MPGLFAYGGFDTLTTGCPCWIVYDAGGVTGGLYYLAPTGFTSGTAMGEFVQDPADPSFVPDTAGLYASSASALGATRDITYDVNAGTPTGGVVASITIHWIATGDPGSGPCPLIEAVPAPVLTATPVYNPTPGLNDVRLDWTESFSVDPHFIHSQYPVNRKPVGGSYGTLAVLFDTGTYLDVGVPVGGSYTWQVYGTEPCIGGGYPSNEVTLTSITEVPAPSARGAWGVLAA